MLKFALIKLCNIYVIRDKSKNNRFIKHSCFAYIIYMHVVRKAILIVNNYEFSENKNKNLCGTS